MFLELELVGEKLLKNAINGVDFINLTIFHHDDFLFES